VKFCGKHLRIVKIHFNDEGQDVKTGAGKGRVLAGGGG
jgi:hypothetical protein